LDDKRTPIEDNDIPDIIARFNNLEAEKERKRIEQSFFVPVEELQENDYDLSINKYKEIEYEEVEYEEPLNLIRKIRDYEKAIIEGLNNLEELLNGK
jgi:type I restriction enzyme M protein